MTEQETITTLSQLASDLFSAKFEEEGAKAARIAIEEKIAALIPGPERGQKTVALPEGVKITVERGFNYKADCVTIQELYSGLPNVPLKIKTTRELDERGYEWFRENDKDMFARLAQYVTVTPKKVSVAIRAAMYLEQR